MTRNNASFAVATLAGALLIHLALACSSGSASVRGLLDGSTEAHADTPAAAAGCSRWEVQGFVPPKFTKKEVAWGFDDRGQPNLYSVATFDAFALPDGWEPLNGGTIGSPIVARHCLSSP